jgi:cyclase
VIPRIIPVLLLEDGGLVKTVGFRDARYVGDPINTVRIFNDKQVDEIVLLDIGATLAGREPDAAAIEEIASEAFMPLGYGGGVRDLGTATRLIQLGVEKVIVNSAATERQGLIREIADHLGSSTIVVSIDAARQAHGGYEVRSHGGTRPTGLDARTHAQAMAAAGAGELILQSIDRDGAMVGYDLELIRQVAGAVDIPVVACGGAGSLEDMVAAIRSGGAAAAAAGSMFVFHGKRSAVLVTYPTYERRVAAFSAAVARP